MMKTTMTLATNLHCSPFEIFAQDCDEVIMMINFYLILAEHPEKMPKIAENRKTGMTKQDNQRIRVNDKTATGGWY